MELAFESKSLRTICEKEVEANRELGPAVAELLQHRLADLRAARSVHDLVAGKPRVVHSTDSEFMVVDLCNGYRIIFNANHPKNPVTESGMLDWSKVSRVKIIQLERNNE